MTRRRAGGRVTRPGYHGGWIALAVALQRRAGRPHRVARLRRGRSFPFHGCRHWPMKIDDDYPPEKLAALRTVRKLVEFWQISPQELGGPLPPVPAPPAVAQPIRYRHPVSGETWDGQGEHPAWLRDALLKQGYTVDELKRAVAAPEPDRDT